MVGFDNERVKFNSRVKEFVINSDEQLIGLELDRKDAFLGLTWLKIKVKPRKF